MKTLLLTLIVCLSAARLPAQQIGDPEFNPPVPAPLYPTGQGPIIRIDEGHFNFHTLEGRYQPFAQFLEKDGYQLKAYRGQINSTQLAETDILVVSNALHESNVRSWARPILSAFTPTEIELLRQWVEAGGALFLIADHMPLAGAAADLGKAFGFDFYDGFAFQVGTNNSRLIATPGDSTLLSSPVTEGRNESERVDSVVSFTGQAFPLPEGAIPVLRFGADWEVVLPDTAWQFRADTPSKPIGGWSQGALLAYGKGRVAVFGEAAMFSAQVAGPQKQKMGMNAPIARQNPQFLLNVIHWLDGEL